MTTGPPGQVPLLTIAREWGRIGCTGFGGPPAHIALLRVLCVQRRGWLSATEFEDGVAVTSLLPGPASTQLAIFCAWRVGGPPGAIVGGVCFIVPALVTVLALSALFLAASAPAWIRGAAAGAGAAVPAVAAAAAVSLLPASWKRARTRSSAGPLRDQASGGDEEGPAAGAAPGSDQSALTWARGRVAQRAAGVRRAARQQPGARARWAVYLGAGVVVAVLAGPWVVAALLISGVTELVVRTEGRPRRPGARGRADDGGTGAEAGGGPGAGPGAGADAEPGAGPDTGSGAGPDAGPGARGGERDGWSDRQDSADRDESGPGGARAGLALPAVWAARAAAGSAGAGGLLSLAWVAVKVGALSFGGGFVIIPLMQHDAVHTYHWMTAAQFLTAVALGQVTPGPVVATIGAVGYAAAGVGGGLLAALIAFTPSFVFVLGGAARFDQLRASPAVQAFLSGAGPAAIGAIAGAAVTLGLALTRGWQVAVLAAALGWLLVLRRGVVAAIVGAAACGVIVTLAGLG
jgi:chromate transporter